MKHTAPQFEQSTVHDTSVQPQWLDVNESTVTETMGTPGRSLANKNSVKRIEIDRRKTSQCRRRWLARWPRTPAVWETWPGVQAGATCCAKYPTLPPHELETRRQLQLLNPFPCKSNCSHASINQKQEAKLTPLTFQNTTLITEKRSKPTKQL